MQDQFMALLTAICTHPISNSIAPMQSQHGETRKRDRDEKEEFTASKRYKPMPLKYVVVIPDFEYLRRYSFELFALQTRSVCNKGYKYKLFIPEPVYEELLARSQNLSESCQEALWNLSFYHRLCMANNASTHSVYRIWQHKQTRYSEDTFLDCIREIAPKFDQCDILVLTTHVGSVSSRVSDPRIVVNDRIETLVQM